MFAALEQFPGRIALINEDGTTLDYGQLLMHGARLADAVAGRCLILSLCSNTAESITGYVGFMRAGMVQLLVNDTIDPEFLQRLIRTYAPNYVFCPTATNHRLEGCVAQTLGSYQLLRLNAQARPLHKDLALLLSTSGSTGNPKLVRISYENLRANTEAIIQSLNILPDDRAMTTMPMSYSYGLSILNTHLTQGASAVVTEATAMHREFWKLMKEHRVTTFGGVPYFYEMLKKLRFRSIDLPALRYVTQAGGKLSPALADEFRKVCEEKKLRFYVMYGQTEATARMSCLCLTDHPKKAASIGKAIPGGQFSLIDADGNAMDAAGTAGELIYQGRNVSMGFAESADDLALGDLHNGMLKTGDLATRDADGYFYIVGRKKHFLKVFGIRISLTDVEDILKAQGYECACSGSDDRLVIYMTTVDDKDKIESMIAERTGIHRSGFHVVRIDKIPRTSSGKVLYKELESLQG